MKNLLRITLLIVIIQLAGISIGQQQNFWGTTSEGGISDAGSIFKTDTNGGNLTTVYSFGEIDGEEPHYSKLCKASNGKYYGLTFYGGKNNLGVIFEFDHQNNSYRTLYNFDAGFMGCRPLGNLMQASNGKLYGLTTVGGVNGSGVLFEFDISTNQFTKRADFGYVNGSMPSGTLLEASNGKLYGLASLGGPLGRGTLFEFNFNTNIFSKKIDFNIVNGDRPLGSLMEATNGKLYGVTRDGGTSNTGTLFEYTISTNTLVKIIDFLGSSTGAEPYEGPIQAANGKLYGLTTVGGTNNQGVLYEYDLTINTITKKLDFISSVNGKGPRGSLIETLSGNLYGMTYQGGTSDKGLLFQYNYLTNQYNKNVDFNGTQKGAFPMGTLLKVSNNKFLGMTLKGGVKGKGVIFEYDFTTDVYSKLLDFGTYSNSKNPKGKLTYADNGKLYGITFFGGANNEGVLYELDLKSEKVNIKYDSHSSPSGFFPISDLVNTNDGFLYGLALRIGAPLGMALYKYDYIRDTVINVYTFSTSSIAIFRKYSLFLHSNGKLYGIGIKQSQSNQTLFEFDINANSLIELYQFQSQWSFCFLSEGPGGIIYGVNSQSQYPGSNGFLFKYNLTTNTFSNLHNFSGSNGNTPIGELVPAKNGKLYGVTTYGGLNNKGVLYNYDPLTNIFSKLLDFIDSTGVNPEDGMSELKPGKLYGTTKLGGNNNLGVIYEYDYNTNTYLKKSDFITTNVGSYPMGKLTRATNCIIKRNSISESVCISYVSPSGKYTWINSGIYKDTLVSQGCDSILTINLTLKKVNNSIVIISPTTLASNDFQATYQWLDCNNNYAIIPNETGQLFTATAIGNYAVEVSANGCVDTSTCYPITVVGINENQLNQNLAVFPNPTNSNVTLSLGGMYGAFTTQVYNVHGKLIKEQVHQSNNQVEVELGNSEGIYFIHLITNSGEKVVRKVVKN